MKLLISLFLLLSFNILGQNVNNVWYFGDGNFLDFNANFNNPILSGQGVEIATPTSIYCQEGSSTMCDANGDLLFYNNSENVFDRNYNLMPNGGNLIGDAQTSAQTLAIPKPGSSSIYYIFHMDYAASTPNTGLFYSEVDMSLNGGMGNVTAMKNVSVNIGASSEQLKAITHCNGQDIWIMAHSSIGNTFHAIPVTTAGIGTPVSTSIGANYSNVFSGMRYMTCSPNGNQIGITGDMGGDPSIEIFDFDNLTGKLCNPQYELIPDFVGGYGIEFSADGTKVFTTSFQLHQFDLLTSSWYTYPPIEIGGSIMRGPNDKMYIVSGCDYYDAQAGQMSFSRNIHVIDDPNLVGAAANLQIGAYVTPREAGLGLSTCYYPTQTISNCDPMLPLFAATSTSICENDCINFTNNSTGASIDSYTWSFPGGIPASFNGPNPPPVCFAAQGTYNVALTVTDCAGLSETEIIQIVVSDCSGPPTADFNVPALICSGECLNFTDLSSSNTTQWNWTFNGSLTQNSTVQNPQNICFDTPGIYTIELEAANLNGTDVHQETIEVVASPDAGIDHDYQFCESEPVIDLLAQLAAGIDQSGIFEDLSNSGGLIGSTFDPSLSGQGTFTVQYILDNGQCSDTADFEIYIESFNTAGIDGQTTLCDYDNPIDLFSVISGNPLAGGVWSPALTGGNSIFDPQTDAAGIYTYTVAPLVCTADSSEATVAITFVSEVLIDNLPPFCSNSLPQQLTANVNNGQWNGDGVNSQGVFDPELVGPGVYIIEYLVNEDNCLASDTVQIQVAQELSLDLGSDMVICNDEKVTLTVALNSGDAVVWNDGSSEAEYSINFSDFEPNDVVTVSAEVTNFCGVINDQISFEVEDCEIYIYVPNAFTPDGDEFNQMFLPIITGENINSHEFRIYNRWGHVVFVSYDINVGWDGTFNGELVADGIYTWTIDINRTKQDQVEVVTKKGHVSVLR